jgi:hypothetical protein
MKEWLKQLLTKIFSNGFLVLLIVAVFYILYLRECKRPPACPAKDEVIVKKVDWDAMVALADKPAVTHIDTVYIKGKTVYVYLDKPLIPTVDPKDTSINIYADTLLKKDIDVSYTFKVKGVLLNRKWEYRPITTLIYRTDTIYVPKPFEVEKIVKTPQRGLFGYGIAGGNGNSFLFGGGLDFITKKNTEMGYLYQRFGTENFHSVKVGIKLFSK